MRRTPATALAAALLAAGLALAGCGSAGSAGGDSAEGVAAPEEAGDGKGGQQGAAEAGAREDASGKDAGGDNKPGADERLALADRHVVRTATLTVVTDDVSGQLEKARTAAVRAGGYAGDEKTDRDADGNERSRITLRIPPDEYDGVLEDLGGLGELEERKVSTKDVTDQMVDVESRIKTQQASVARVRKLMDQADELSDIVTLESELSTRQAELESLQARQASLKERTGMATVTLVLEEPDAASASDETDDGPSVQDALAGGWDAFVTTLRWIVVVLGAVLPFAAALALLVLLWRSVRGRLPERLRPSAGSGGPGSAPPAVPVPAPLGAEEGTEQQSTEQQSTKTDRPET